MTMNGKDSRFANVRPFVPANTTPSVVLLREQSPMILISPEAHDAMSYIVALSPEEVGWLGSVERIDDNLFLIEDVYLFDQEVGPVHTKLDPVAVGKFFNNLANQPDGVNKANKIRFWGHSHGFMAVQPSGTYYGGYGDLAQMRSFGESADYFIMGIANKQGDLRFEIFFYSQGYKVTDVPWKIYQPAYQPELFARIEQELQQKVVNVPVEESPLYSPQYLRESELNLSFEDLEEDSNFSMRRLGSEHVRNGGLFTQRQSQTQRPQRNGFIPRRKRPEGDRK